MTNKIKSLSVEAIAETGRVLYDISFITNENAIIQIGKYESHVLALEAIDLAMGLLNARVVQKVYQVCQVNRFTSEIQNVISEHKDMSTAKEYLIAYESAFPFSSEYVHEIVIKE